MSRKTFAQYSLIASLFVIGSALIIVKLPLLEAIIQKFFSLLSPFYIGFAIAYILNPIINYQVSRFKLNRGIAIASTYLILIVAVGLFIWWIVPQVMVNSVAIVNEVSQRLNTLEFDTKSIEDTAFGQLFKIDVGYYAEKTAAFANVLFANLSTFLIILTATLFNTFVGIVISIYMATSKESIVAHLKRLNKRLFPTEVAEEIQHLSKEANEIFSHFLTGLILEAITVSVLAFIGFNLLGVQYALTLALILCCTAIIPYFGFLMGTIPAVVTTYLYDPSKALWVLLFMLVLQQFDANFIGPRIMGNKVGISPLWIMFFIAIFGGFWGAPGVILAIPTGALLIILAQHLFRIYFKKAS